MKTFFVIFALVFVSQYSFADSSNKLDLPGWALPASISCTDSEAIDQIKSAYSDFSERYNRTHQDPNRSRLYIDVKVVSSGLIDLSFHPVARFGNEQLENVHVYIQPSRGCLVLKR
jgi:hypothetical protein